LHYPNLGLIGYVLAVFPFSSLNRPGSQSAPGRWGVARSALIDLKLRLFIMPGNRHHIKPVRQFTARRNNSQAALRRSFI
jgi:hypothetical protein